MFCIWIRNHFYCHWNVLSDNCHSPCHAYHFLFFSTNCSHSTQLICWQKEPNTKHTLTHLSMVFMTHRNALLGNRKRNSLHMVRETTNGFHFQTKKLYSICHKPLNCVRFDWRICFFSQKTVKIIERRRKSIRLRWLHTANHHNNDNNHSIFISLSIYETEKN